MLSSPNKEWCIMVSIKCVRNIKNGISFLLNNIKDTIRLSVYKLKTISYRIAPSTIRYKLNTSVIFLKFKKKILISFLFKLKIIAFNFRQITYSLLTGITLYFYNIFIRHWKLFIFVFALCAALVLYEYFDYGKIGFLYIKEHLQHFYDHKKIFDLYLSLAGILATFVGLYFTASSIIAQTVYSKVNGEIKQLLNSIRISNIYIESIIILLAFILVSIFFMLHGIYIGLWNLAIVFILSFVSIISFWELAQYMFLFFNPAYLIQEHILPKLKKQIDLITRKSIYKYDPSFQNTAYVNAYNIFDSYDSIVEFATNQDLVQLKVIRNILQDAIKNLVLYIGLKSKIPSHSYWFPQEYNFNKYTDVTDIDINLSKNTGTIAGQHLVRDMMWMERRYLKIINKCLNVLYTKKELRTYYEVILNISECLKALNSKGKNDEVFFIIQNLFNPFNDELQYNDEFLGYLADTYMAIFVELSLSFNTHIVTSDITKITVRKLLKNNFIYEKANLPNRLKTKLEEIIEKLKFEKHVENRLVTPDWHVQQLLTKECDKFLFEWYDNILTFSLKEVEKYVDDKFIETHADIAVFVFNRACELKYKIMNSFKLLCDRVGEKSATIEFEHKLQNFNTKIINFIIRLAPHLEIKDEKLPDSIGFAYIMLYGELEQTIFEEGVSPSTTIVDMLKTLISLAMLQINNLKSEMQDILRKETDKKLLPFKLNCILAKLSRIYIEIMDVFGYLYLFDDVYENRNIREKLIPVFDEFVKTIGLKPIVASIGDNNALRISSQTGHNLKVTASEKLHELKLVWTDMRFGGATKNTQQPKFKSKLLKYACHADGRLWQCPDGYSIFACVYLLNKCDEQQKQIILSDWKTNSLYRECYDD